MLCGMLPSHGNICFCICVSVYKNSGNICLQWKPRIVACFVRSLTQWVWKQEKMKMYVLQCYGPILFWEGCKHQPMCLEINPRHNLKCVMSPHLLYFGKAEFTSDIRSLPGNPSGNLFIFALFWVKTFVLMPFQYPNSFGDVHRD